MTAANWTELLKQVDGLNADEQLRLAALLVERARKNYPRANGPRKWSDIRGMAQPSLLGEDPQLWVTRTRRESDKHRLTPGRPL